MFNLIRRISYGAIPRPDRPWEEDATSNAPAPRRKRRLSTTERDVRDESEELSRGKKARSGSQSPETEAQEERDTPMPQPEAETSEVKEVTKGVKDVVLDEPSEKPTSDVAEETPAGEQSTVAPESVPLPDGGNSELDDLADAPSSPAGSEDEVALEDGKEEEDSADAETSPSDSKDEQPAPTAVASEVTTEKDAGDLKESKADEPDSKPAEEPTTSAKE